MLIGTLRRTEMVRRDKNNKIIAKKVVNNEDYDGSIQLREFIYKEGKTKGKEEGISGGQKYKTRLETAIDPTTGKEFIIKAKYLSGDATTTYKAIKDEFGSFTGKYETKTTYPKGSGKAPVISETTRCPGVLGILLDL